MVAHAHAHVYVYVCMCVCVCICIYEYIHVCMSLSICQRACTQTHTHILASIPACIPAYTNDHNVLHHAHAFMGLSFTQRKVYFMQSTLRLCAACGLCCASEECGNGCKEPCQDCGDSMAAGLTASVCREAAPASCQPVREGT